MVLLVENCRDYILTVDNFYKDPDHIRNLAVNNSKIQYKTPTLKDEWRGFRYFISNGEDEPPIQSIKKKVSNYYQLNEDNYSIFSCLHYTIKKTKDDCYPSFEEYKYHRDRNFTYAGLIYLHPDPPKNSGTTLLDPATKEKILIENVYNRLICYPSNILHGPTDFFGYDLQTGRLTLTFFLKKL